MTPQLHGSIWWPNLNYLDVCDSTLLLKSQQNLHLSPNTTTVFQFTTQLKNGSKGRAFLCQHQFGHQNNLKFHIRGCKSIKNYQCSFFLMIRIVSFEFAFVIKTDPLDTFLNKLHMITRLLKILKEPFICSPNLKVHAFFWQYNQIFIKIV